MKRVIIVVLVVCLALLPILVIAQPRYTADIDLVASINGKTVQKNSEYIYLYNGDTVDLTLKLKTDENFYAGPFSAEILYTKNTLKYNTFNWNTSGKFYSCCKSYSNLSPKDSLLKIDMIPSSADCKSAPNSLNESLLNMRFTATGSNDAVGKAYISSDSQRDTDNPFGTMYLACYPDNGRFDGDRYDYGEGISIDLSGASVQFKITNAGDANTDGKITSMDSLDILQYTTGMTQLNSNALKAADTDQNGKVNASDALAVLQITTGLTTINDIINR